MEKKLKNVYTNFEEMIRPSHTALLIIDMQQDYCGIAAERKGLDPKPKRAIIPVIRQLVETARTVEVLPIFVINTLDRAGYTHSGVAIANEIHVWGTYGVSDSAESGSDLVQGLGYISGDIIVEKHRNSAFFGTDLDLILRCNSIQTVVLTGQATYACIDSTARDALCHDYYVTVVEDAVATVSEELEIHEATLKVLNHFLPIKGVARSTEICEIWNKEKKRD